jgi:hypothetical protein
MSQILKIDLTSFEHSVKTFSQPFIPVVGIFNRSNSFIKNNKIFQVKTSSKQAKLKITDITSNEILKEETFTNNEIISFEKNIPKTKKGIRESKSFLNKLSVNKMGVSVLYNDGKYKLEVGSYVIGGGSAGVMTSGFGTFSLGASENVSFSPGSPSYSLYSLGSIFEDETTIEGIFNENLNLIKDGFPSSAYSLVNNFLEDKENLISVKTLFWFKGNLILGAGIKNTKGFSFYSFKQD